LPISDTLRSKWKLETEMVVGWLCGWEFFVRGW
jgi:hypothetical protein